jgi:hypothetical protein
MPKRTGTVRAMRHLGSLLAGLLIAPAVWLLLAIGQPQATATFTTWQNHNTYHTADLIGPVAYLAAGGLLLGLIASVRVSPLGPILAGTAYAAMYGVLFVNPFWGLDRIPNRIDAHFAVAHPRIPVTNGTLALLSFCLLASMISAKRWRRWPEAAAPGQEPAQTPEAGQGGQAPPLTFPPASTEANSALDFTPSRYEALNLPDPLVTDAPSRGGSVMELGPGDQTTMETRPGTTPGTAGSPPLWPTAPTAAPTIQPTVSKEPMPVSKEPMPATGGGAEPNPFGLPQHDQPEADQAQSSAGPWSAPPRGSER